MDMPINLSNLRDGALFSQFLIVNKTFFSLSLSPLERRRLYLDSYGNEALQIWEIHRHDIGALFLETINTGKNRWLRLRFKVYVVISVIRGSEGVKCAERTLTVRGVLP